MTGSSVIPSTPSGLCISREDFLGPDFSVDSFLAKFTVSKTSEMRLEVLRDDLGVYLKVLRSSMIQLINDDYADFVNLSTNLVGLDSTIEVIKAPLTEYKEQILSVLTALAKAESEVQNKLERRTEIRAQKAALRNLEHVSNTLTKIEKLIQNKNLDLSGDLTERVAAEINHLNFCVSKASPDSAFIESMRPRLKDVGDILRFSLDQKFLDALEIKDGELLKRCLRIYSTIEKIDEAHGLIRSKMISPILAEILTEEKIVSVGLKITYSDILDKTLLALEPLLKLTSVYSAGCKVPIKGFNFLTASLWIEIVERLEEGFSFVFSAGNPDVFFSNYEATISFISSIEKHFSVQEINKFREEDSYLRFQGKWNLQVYFQIRFQEISMPFEKILEYVLSPDKEESNEFRLESASALKLALIKVWSPNIFIQALSHRFFKLTLQILSRYSVAIDSLLSKENKSSDTVSFANLWLDLNKLIEEVLPAVLKDFVLPRFEELKDEEFIDKLIGSFNIGRDQLKRKKKQASDIIMKELVRNGLILIKKVNEIPQIYRNQSKEISPNEPSKYIKALLRILSDFVSGIGGLRTESEKEALVAWMRFVGIKLGKEFKIQANEVLEGVLKNNESIKRMKKIREDSSEFEDGGDGSKIQTQVRLDAEAFVNGLEDLGAEDVPELEEIKELVIKAS